MSGTSTVERNPLWTGLRCFACDLAHDPKKLQGVCTACGMPLRVDYDLSALRRPAKELIDSDASLWRYRRVLPVVKGEATPVSYTHLTLPTTSRV